MRFLWCILAHKYPVVNNTNRPTTYVKHFDTLNLGCMQFPMKVKDISKFEKLNNLNVIVFELNKVLPPVHNNTNYFQPQKDLSYENDYCLVAKLHMLINKEPHMKHVCRRCLTAFSSEQGLSHDVERMSKTKTC